MNHSEERNIFNLKTISAWFEIPFISIVPRMIEALGTSAKEYDADWHVSLKDGALPLKDDDALDPVLCTAAAVLFLCRFAELK